MLGSVGANLDSYLLTLFLSHKAENQPIIYQNKRTKLNLHWLRNNYTNSNTSIQLFEIISIYEVA